MRTPARALSLSVLVAGLSLASAGAAGAATAQAACAAPDAGYVPAGVCDVRVEIVPDCDEPDVVGYRAVDEGSTATTVNATWTLSDGTTLAVPNLPLQGELPARQGTLTFDLSRDVTVNPVAVVDRACGTTTVAAAGAATGGRGVAAPAAGALPAALSSTGASVGGALAAAGLLVAAGAVAVRHGRRSAEG